MKKHLKIFVILTFLGIILVGCKLTNDYYVKYEVLLDVTGWNLPDTAAVNSSFDIPVSLTIDNTCLSNPTFVLYKNSDSQYSVWGKAIFETHGEDCNKLSVGINVDSTINLKLTTVGKYYFYFLRQNAYIKDSIYIKP